MSLKDHLETTKTHHQIQMISQSPKHIKKEGMNLNLGCKVFLLLTLFVMNYIAKSLPATDLSYFSNMIRLDYLYAGLAVIDKDLRGQLIGLSSASIISHYLQMQDYVNRTPATEFINNIYLDIQPFLYHSMLGAFALWGIRAGFNYVQVRRRNTNLS